MFQCIIPPEMTWRSAVRPRFEIKLDENDPNTGLPTETNKTDNLLTEFQLLTEDEVRNLVKRSPTKHCELDPAPTWIVKDCLEEVLPMLTKILNLSLQLGDVPVSLKHAIIKPLLKKMGLDLVYKNYRPVSNLTYLSKLLERAVAKQLLDHLMQNNLIDSDGNRFDFRNRLSVYDNQPIIGWNRIGNCVAT